MGTFWLINLTQKNHYNQKDYVLINRANYKRVKWTSLVKITIGLVKKPTHLPINLYFLNYPTIHMLTYLHFKSPSYKPFNHKVYLLGLTNFSQIQPLYFKIKFGH
jgi:hypothetical protein